MLPTLRLLERRGDRCRLLPPRLHASELPLLAGSGRRGSPHRSGGEPRTCGVRSPDGALLPHGKNQGGMHRHARTLAAAAALIGTLAGGVCHLAGAPSAGDALWIATIAGTLIPVSWSVVRALVRGD